MTTTVILQARTSSSRLPGKVLLPINGMPAAVLAALRAGNRGLPVIVATSTDKTDDLLVKTLTRHGVRSMRGPLHDTLRRFVQATNELEDDTIIVRLTADNLFPDGDFIQGLLDDFLGRNLDYLACDAGTSGLPYGVRGEVFRVKDLRTADREASSVFDREHVTPWIIRRYGRHAYTRHSNLKLDLLRATVDQLDDYLRVAQVFEKVHDPVFAPVEQLSQHLATLPDTPFVEQAVDDLVIGTAQFGANYGIANRTGQPDADGIQKIVHTAIINGVYGFDTARAYGSSEFMLGKALTSGWESRTRIITKLAPFALPATTEPDIVHELVDKSLAESSRDLMKNPLSTVLLHRAEFIDDWGGSAWARMLHHRSEGRIQQIGVSVQDPDELMKVIPIKEIEHIQLPFNLLDWRWDKVLEILTLEREKRQITVHARSALLQGLIPSDDPRLWAQAGVRDSAFLQKWLRLQAQEFKRQNVADLAIAFVRSQPWCDGVVIGIENMAQLKENIKLFAESRLTAIELETLVNDRPKLSAQTLNPSTWRLLT